MEGMGVDDELRRAIREAKISLYRLAQETKISQSQLGKWMARKARLRSERLDTLAVILGYKITLIPVKKKKGR
jgi:hypothetical protein